jgi:hypothetical protein
MSKSWKCTICGTTMISKCPSQRSIFMGPMDSILNSVLTFNKVMPLKKDGCAELFISYTTGKPEQSTGQMLKGLIELLNENPHYLENLGCGHHWVLDSETDTECSLGCTHSNLSTPIPEARKKKPQNLEHMLRDYYSVISVALEQARLNINITKPSYDTPTEEDFQHLKYTIGTMLDKIGKGEHLKAPYRVRMAGKSWRKDNYVYFDRREDAVKYCIGYCLTSTNTLELDKLDDMQENYVTDEFGFQIPCGICGKVNDDELLIRKDGSVAHVKCIRAEKQGALSRKRMGTIRLGNIDPDAVSPQRGLCLEGYVESAYMLDNAYTFRTGRSGLTLRIFKVCTKPEMNQLIEDITARFAKGRH